MIEHTLDTRHAILTVRPMTPLQEKDFDNLAQTVDPYIQANGELTGLVIETPTFPGWERFSAMLDHIRFIREHQKSIKYVGLVTDSAAGKVGEKLGAHFTAATIRHFPGEQVEAARQWIINQE